MTDDRFALAFLGTFESLRMGPTFARGRRDERAGHVRSLTISTSLVVAQVRGPDDPKAFRSRIAVRAFGASDWARVEEALVAEARYTADLLAGRMPDGINAVFAEAGLSLVPLSLDEVAMDCTCERWPMPCIHLAATTYALVRSFEEDPFGAFAWRGRTRDELLTQLRDLRGARAVEATDATSARSSSDGLDDLLTDPGDLGDISDFWGEIGEEGPPLAPVASRPGSSLRPDALLDQLDPPPLAHEGRPIVDLLRSAYRALPDDGERER